MIHKFKFRKTTPFLKSVIGFPICFYFLNYFFIIIKLVTEMEIFEKNMNRYDVRERNNKL